MFLSDLTLFNYKNIDSARLHFDAGLNCLTGLNGMGKTNCLDAIFTACVGKSHFNLTDQQIIKQGAEFCRIDALFISEGIRNQVIVKIPLAGKKLIELDGKAYRKMGDHLGKFPVVMIAPDDTEIITGSSEIRRKFMDTTLCQIDHAYTQNLINYNKILKQRNAFLKLSNLSGNRDLLLLDTYDSQLSSAGQQIFEARVQYIEELKGIFLEKYGLITSGKELVDIEYQSQLFSKSWIELLRESRQKDQILERTTCGIHRDDLIISIESRDSRKFASQGQSKSLLFSLKFAEYQFLSRKSGMVPVLLLDDIFDKLDDVRVQNLLSLINKGPYGQVFVTDTSIERLEKSISSLFDSFKSFEVENGNIKELKHEKT